MIVLLHKRVYAYAGKSHMSVANSVPTIRAVRDLIPITTLDRINRHVIKHKTGLDVLKDAAIAKQRVVNKTKGVTKLKNKSEPRYIYLPDENGVDLVKVKLL